MTYSASYSANQYRTNSVNTSPLQLVVMCYDGMIRFMKKARQSIEEKNIEGKVKYINKTIAIVDELQASLDFVRGGEVARNLDRVYDYMNNELMKVALKEEVEILEHLEKMAVDLRAAWAKIAAETPAANPAPNHSGLTITG
ncbi:MAG: flagellar export chaperone FliS [Acidobacteriota bacterium]|nr:flagellar export chaperone FliS [Acidobacteriota bacterium]